MLIGKKYWPKDIPDEYRMDIISYQAAEKGLDFDGDIYFDMNEKMRIYIPIDIRRKIWYKHQL